MNHFWQIVFDLKKHQLKFISSNSIGELPIAANILPMLGSDAKKAVLTNGEWAIDFPNTKALFPTFTTMNIN